MSWDTSYDRPLAAQGTTAPEGKDRARAKVYRPLTRRARATGSRPPRPPAAAFQTAEPGRPYEDLDSYRAAHLGLKLDWRKALVQRDGSESFFDKAAPCLQPLRNAKLLAERFSRFVKRESGRISRQFEKHATRLTEVDRVKIGAVQNRSYVQMLGNLLAPLLLRGIVFGAKRNMMYRSSTGASESRIRIDQQINVISKRVTLGRKTKAVPLLADFAKTQDVQDGGGLVCLLLQQGDAEKTTNRMLRRNR